MLDLYWFPINYSIIADICSLFDILISIANNVTLSGITNIGKGYKYH
jgi:hypothetical protein